VPVVTLYGLQRFELLRGLRTEEALTLMSKAMHDHPSAFLQQTLCRGPGYTLAIANGYSVRLWDYEVTAIDLSIKEMTFTSATKDNEVTVDTFDGDIRETGTLSSKCAVFYVSDTATRAGDLKVLKYSRVSGGLRGEPGVHPGLQELEVLQPELKDRWLYPNSPPAQLCCNFVGPMIQRVSQIRLSPC